MQYYGIKWKWTSVVLLMMIIEHELNCTSVVMNNVKTFLHIADHHSAISTKLNENQQSFIIEQQFTATKIR